MQDTDKNPHENVHYVNTIIFGGGISGLWTLNFLKSKGISAILLENDKLGCAQSGLSQGIIHGGMKYALTNKITKSTDAIKTMPEIWQKYLNQQGDFLLKNVEVLSDHQLLYTPKSLMRGFKQFIYQKMLTSKCDILPSNQYNNYPDFINNSKFKNCLIKLNENIIDIPSLIKALFNNTKNSCFNYKDIISYAPKNKDLNNNLKNNLNNTHILNITSNKSNSKPIKISADNIVLCAGEGNQQLLNILNIQDPPKMQLRPLHMVWLKSDKLPKLYLHCMQKTDKPLITISSHPININNNKNKYIWYLGGDLAENGCDLSKDEQIKKAKNILNDLFPGFLEDLNQNKNKQDITWGSIRIDRAEGVQANNKRPEGPVVVCENNLITAWPTKLTFAPLIAQMIYDKLFLKLELKSGDKLLKSEHDLAKYLNKSDIYKPVWD